MKDYFLLLLLFLGSCHLVGQELFRLKLSPVDLIEKEGVDYNHRVDHLMNTGEDLFCAMRGIRYLVKMDANAALISNIGRSGGGPGEFAARILTYSTNGDSVFALSAANLDRLHHFTSDGQYIDYITIKPKNLRSYSSGSCNTFAVSPNTVVLPAPPQSGHLAYAYDFQGGATPIGDLIFDKRNAYRLEQNPFLNDTLWVYGDGHWYAVFRYVALIFKYDADFKMVDSFRLENARINLLIEELEAIDPTKFTAPQVLFKDVKYHQGSLYIMAPKTLIRVNANSGDIPAMYSFYKDKKVSPEKETFQEMHYKTFAITKKNRLLLGPAWMSGHYLMEATLPDLKDSNPNL